MTTPSQYSLGSDADEIARLDAQAAMLAPATRLLLGAAGVANGMRVLDLGTELGHVAQLLAELVGPEGSVTGLDNSRELLAIAEQRRLTAGLEPVQFVEGDVRTWRGDGHFDAVAGRLILHHVPEPAGVVRHHVEALRAGGLVVLIDYDVGTARAEPSVSLVSTLFDQVAGAFRYAGADPGVGARLGLVLAEAGLADIETFGIQAYLPPGDPRAAALLGGITRSLAPKIEEAGIATVAELELETLDERVASALQAAGAVLLPPALVGAWGRTG